MSELNGGDVPAPDDASFRRGLDGRRGSGGDLAYELEQERELKTDLLEHALEQGREKRMVSETAQLALSRRDAEIAAYQRALSETSARLADLQDVARELGWRLKQSEDEAARHAREADAALGELSVCRRNLEVALATLSIHADAEKTAADALAQSADAESRLASLERASGVAPDADEESNIH